jgi:Fe-S-cluster containining protein
MRAIPSGYMSPDPGDEVCELCGICCMRYRGTHWAEGEDLTRWFDLGRQDILRFCRILNREGRWVSGADLGREELHTVAWCECWMDPETGNIRQICPFLSRAGPGRFLCSIQAVKPATCRRYHPWDWANVPHIEIPCPALARIRKY